MKLPLFAQDVRQFLRSKTNWTAVTGIVLAVVGYQTGVIDAVAFTAALLNGVGVLCIRDAVSK